MVFLEPLIDCLVKGDEQALACLLSLREAMIQNTSCIVSERSEEKDEDFVDINGLSLLHWASASDTSQFMIPMLIQHHTTTTTNTLDIDIIDSNGRTPLHFMVWKERVYGVLSLLHAKADMNIQCFQYKYTPLHLAAIRKNRELYDILIAYNCDISLRDEFRRLASDYWDDKLTVVIDYN